MSETATIPTEFQEAAKWWADKVRHGAKQDNGDPLTSGGMMVALMLMSTKSPAQQPAKDVDAFERHLAVALMEEYRRRWPKTFGGFGCDYGPDRIIADAASRAGLEVGPATFPIKTVMWIDPGKVTVRYGYGADVETVWRGEPTESY